MLKIYKDYNEENTSLVDDSAEKVIYNPEPNFICLKPFQALEKGGTIRVCLENLVMRRKYPRIRVTSRLLKVTLTRGSTK
ncbi:hypothetical protein V6Z12_A04G021700 [Gossypium hirsutum]